LFEIEFDEEEADVVRSGLVIWFKLFRDWKNRDVCLARLVSGFVEVAVVGAVVGLGCLLCEVIFERR